MQATERAEKMEQQAHTDRFVSWLTHAALLRRLTT